MVKNLEYQTSELDDCNEYHDFLEELKRIHDKVKSGDLSDFTELKLE